MMTLKRIALCLFLNLALLPGLAQAHFVWLLSQPSEGNESQIQLYFGELAEADDPSLLDNVASAQLWQMDTTGKKIDLTTSRGDESITATPIMKTGPTVVATSHNWGVLQRGDLSFVLQYFAKTYHNAKPAEWSQIDSSTALKLDITPQLLDDQQVQLLVKWEGKPLANAELKVEDDQGDVELEGKTDAEGKFSFKAPADHIYSIRAKHVESKAGESDGKKYSEIRYYSTLALKL